MSTPITWDEIDDVEPRECTIATIPGRFARLGDLHKGIDDDAYSLDTLLEWATATAPTRACPAGSSRPLVPSASSQPAAGSPQEPARGSQPAAASS